MTTPLVNVQNQVGQAGGGTSPPTFGSPPGSTVTKHSRRFMHYVSNAMEANGLVNGIVDEGWQYVPYRTLRASITPRQWKSLLISKRAFKVRSMGFKMEHFNPLVEQVSSVGGQVGLTSTFENRPYLMKLTDHNLIIDNMLETKTAGDHNWNTSNGDLTRALPVSQADGALPRVQFNLGQEFLESLTPSGEVVDAWGSFNTFSGFDIQTNMTGEGTGHYWENSGDGQRWYPTTKHANMAPQLKMHDIFALDYDLGAVEYNAFTEINANFVSKPPPVLMRVNPVHGVDGAINIGAQVWTTYYSEIEWLDNNPGLLTLNEASNDVTANTAWDKVKAPLYTLASARSDYSWQEAFAYSEAGTQSSSNHNRSHPYEQRKKSEVPVPRGLPFVQPTTTE